MFDVCVSYLFKEGDSCEVIMPLLLLKRCCGCQLDIRDLKTCPGTMGHPTIYGLCVCEKRGSDRLFSLSLTHTHAHKIYMPEQFSFTLLLPSSLGSLCLPSLTSQQKYAPVLFLTKTD